MQKQKREENWDEKILAYIFIAIMLFVFVAWFRGELKEMREGPTETAKPETQWTEHDNSLLAYTVMEDFVKQRLKSPATADFPGIFDGKKDHITRLENHTYRISSYVDSHNSFGANQRTHFMGEVRQTSEYDWQLVSLNFVSR